MRRSFILLIWAIGYLTVALVDASSSPVAAQSTGSKVYRPRVACTVTTFAKKIMAVTGFHAETNGDSDNANPPVVYHPPSPRSLSTAFGDGQATTIQSQLQAAFNLVPRQPMKDRLCDLDYVLVDDTATEPYAFWESDGQRSIAQANNPQHTTSWTFIGIPISYFPSKMPFSVYEAKVANQIIAKSGVSLRVALSVTPKSGVQDDFTLTLVAIMAHELGHILEHSFERRHSPCSDGLPLQYNTWLSFSAPPPNFHRFATTVDDNTPNDPNIAQIIADVTGAPAGQDKVTLAANDFAKVYQNGNFPSLFANTAPDEDFAEAFKWHILLHPGTALLQSVTISFDKDMLQNRGTDDVIRNYSSRENQHKMKCMEGAEGP